jgi:type VI secretion system protein ImpH
MARYGWRGDSSLEDELFAEPYRFEFFQAVRLLELRSRGIDSAPAAAGDDVVRFRASYDLSFPPSEIRELAKAGPDSPPRMTVSFFGAGGLDGPLPTSFTEAILERLSRRDTATADFLDIFHHRLLSLFYRIHKKYRPALATTTPADHPSARFLFSLQGLGLRTVAAQVPASARLIRYTGLLAIKPRSASGLATMASDYFRVPVQVQQFVGEWVALGADQTTRLGRTGQNNALGAAAVVGTRVWLQDAGIRLKIGPLDAERFASFLPNGEAHWALAELVRLYAGPDLRTTLQLVLEKREAWKVGYTRLGTAVLGRTSWLCTAASNAVEGPVDVPLRRRSWRAGEASS